MNKYDDTFYKLTDGSMLSFSELALQSFKIPFYDHKEAIRYYSRLVCDLDKTDRHTFQWIHNCHSGDV